MGKMALKSGTALRKCAILKLYLDSSITKSNWQRKFELNIDMVLWKIGAFKVSTRTGGSRGLGSLKYTLTVSVSFHPGVLMGTEKFNAGWGRPCHGLANPVMRC